MVDDGRYYWLKLKEDFFQDEIIEWLEEQANGKDYVLFYLKLCLKALKNNGVLIRQVGNMLVPYDVEKLGEMTKTSVDTVAVALKVFKQIGLIEVQDGGQMYLAYLNNMVGSECSNANAQRQKRFRERAKALREGVTNSNATSVTKNNESIEYRDKNIDIKEKYNKKKSDTSSRHKYGSYQNVLLSKEELKKLQTEFPSDWEEWIERVSEYVASKGKGYKDYLATIRSWARREKKGGVVSGTHQRTTNALAKAKGTFDDLRNLI